MRKRQRKKNQKRPWAVEQGETVSATDWPIIVHHLVADAPMPQFIGIDPAAGLGDQTVFYTHTLPTNTERLMSATEIIRAQMEFNRINALRAQEVLDRQRGFRQVQEQALLLVNSGVVDEAEVRRWAMAALRDIEQTTPNPPTMRREEDNYGDRWEPAIQAVMYAHLFGSLGPPLVAPQNRHRWPPEPSPRTTPLRQLPNPAVHPRVPASELGRECNWKEDQSGSEAEGRWLRMPAITGTHGNRQMIMGEKPVRRQRVGPGSRRVIWEGGPAKMSAAEHWQWMREYEREIDQWHELAVLGIPLPAWEEYLDQCDRGAVDWAAVIQQKKQELREKKQVPGVHVINGNARCEFREPPPLLAHGPGGELVIRTSRPLTRRQGHTPEPAPTTGGNG